MGKTLLFLLSVAAYAQIDAGRIAGTVADTTGAVIPNATITVKNDRTGQERTATANSQGYYVILQLPAAVYTITGKAAGLGPQEYREIHIAVGQ